MPARKNEQQRNQIRGTQGKGQPNADPYSNISPGQLGGKDGNKPERSSGATSKESQAESEQRDIGGILRQLRNLQQTHLAYVDAHGERLRKRLAENQEHRQRIADDMQRLEGIVLDLLDECEKSP